MIIRNKRVFVFLASSFLVLFFACQQPGPSKNVNQEGPVMANERSRSDDSLSVSGRNRSPIEFVLTIDTFGVFPPEIDGCSCYFSNDSSEFEQRMYIYADNYAETSFLKINGVMTKFVRTDFKEINSTTNIIKAKSENYELIIQTIDGKQSGDETWLNTGTIKLTDMNGTSISRDFYGECGC